MGRGAVVDIAVSAEVAFATEGLHIDRHAVADLHAPDIGSRLLHHTDHLVAHGDARHSPWHTSVLDMKVTGADASQGHAHDSVGGLLYRRSRFVRQGKLSFFYISICFHLDGLSLWSLLLIALLAVFEDRGHPSLCLRPFCGGNTQGSCPCDEIFHHLAPCDESLHGRHPCVGGRDSLLRPTTLLVGLWAARPKRTVCLLLRKALQGQFRTIDHLHMADVLLAELLAQDLGERIVDGLEEVGHLKLRSIELEGCSQTA